MYNLHYIPTSNHMYIDRNTIICCLAHLDDEEDSDYDDLESSNADESLRNGPTTTLGRNTTGDMSHK